MEEDQQRMQEAFFRAQQALFLSALPPLHQAQLGIAQNGCGPEG